MSILIGHASIDENGKAQGGTAGDQTGKEVCTRTWYSKPWDFMAIDPTASVREKHASAVEAACANDNVGYDQNQRNTLNTQAAKVSYDLSKIAIPCECDCSSLQNVAAIASGAVSSSSYGSNGWTTSTMKAKLQTAGYKIITDSTYLASEAYCVRGTIYVKSGSHTVTGLTNGSKYADTLSKAGVTTASTSGSSSSTSTGTKLTVDGQIGTNTVKRLQKVLGTTQDGKIDGQNSSCKKYWTSITSSVCSWTGGTSAVVKALQKKVGATADGLLGKNTAMAVQTYLIKAGYSCGSSGADGYFGSGSAKALQNWLNAQ